MSRIDQIVDHLVSTHSIDVLNTGSPEAELVLNEAAAAAAQLNSSFSAQFSIPHLATSSEKTASDTMTIELANFDMDELMNFKPCSFGESQEVDLSIDFDMNLNEIPPPSDTCSPDTHYNSPSNDSMYGDGPLVGLYADTRSMKRRPQGEPTCADSDSDTESRYSCKKARHAIDELLFACPFLKRFPLKYRDCSKFTFKRVRDVKQHLNRIHRTPEFYCPRCYVTFNGAKDRDEHTRDMKCQTQHANGRFEGVTEEQKEQLLLNKGRNKSHEEQWFLIWDIVFPGTSRPKSVYRFNPQEEAVMLLRDVWNTKQREILADVGQADGTIHVLMEKLFDRLEWETRVPSQPVRKGSKQLGRNIATPTDYVTMSGSRLQLEDLLDETPFRFPISPPHESTYS
ncbi:hypothetical protein PG988_006311 [Apiospora saccharicola]